MNSAFFDCTSSLPSRTSTLLRGFARLEIPRYLACALVRSRRTTIRRARYRDREYAAVAHRLDLAAERERLRTGLPRMQERRSRDIRVESVDAVEKKSMPGDNISRS